MWPFSKKSVTAPRYSSRLHAFYTVGGATYCCARVVYTNQNVRKSGIRQAQLNLAHPLHTNYMFVVCRPSRCRSLLVASKMCSRLTIGILPIYFENPYHKHSVSFQKLTCPSWVSHNDRCPRDFIPRG